MRLLYLIAVTAACSSPVRTSPPVAPRPAAVSSAVMAPARPTVDPQAGELPAMPPVSTAATKWAPERDEPPAGPSQTSAAELVAFTPSASEPEQTQRLRAKLAVGRDLYWRTGDACAHYRVMSVGKDGALRLESRTRRGHVEAIMAYQVVIRDGTVAVTGPTITDLPRGAETGVEDDALACTVEMPIDDVRERYAEIGGERWWFRGDACATSEIVDTEIVENAIAACR